MENISGAINVITTVLQNNHMGVTHSTIMMGSNTHVVNVILKQLRNSLSKRLYAFWETYMAFKHNVGRFQCYECDYHSATKQRCELHIASKHIA